MKSQISIHEEETKEGFIDLLPLSTPYSVVADERWLGELGKAPKRKEKSKSRRKILKLDIGSSICKKLDFTGMDDEIKNKKNNRLMRCFNDNNLAIPLDELYDTLPLNNSVGDEDKEDNDLEHSYPKRARVVPETVTSPAPETPTYDWKFNMTKVPISNGAFTKISDDCGGSFAGSKKLFNNLSSSPSLLKQTLKSESTARNLSLMLS